MDTQSTDPTIWTTTREMVTSFAHLAGKLPLPGNPELRLHDCKHSKTSDSHCSLATLALHQYALHIPESLPGMAVETVIIELEDGTQHHILRLVREDDPSEQWIIDYTARQYDATVPTPFVDTYLGWWDRIDSAINTQNPENGLDQEIGAYSAPQVV